MFIQVESSLDESVPSVCTPSPRRRKTRPSSEHMAEASKPKKKRRTGSRKTARKRNESMLRVVLFGAAGLAVIYGLFFMDWQDIGGTLGMSRSNDKLLKDLEYYQNEQIDLINTFQNSEQAKAAIPRLNEIAKELAIISAEFDDWVIVEDEDDIKAVMQLPPEVKEEHSRFAREFKQKRIQHSVRLTQEINRLKNESGLGNFIDVLVVNSQTFGGRYAREWKLNKAKEGLYKEGYSPVTAGTVLTIGMQLQGINSQYDWQDCIVKEIYSDGKVRVNFIDGNSDSLFGGQGFLDYKYERDRLRIPDVVLLKNTTSSGTGRRIDVSAPRVTGGSQRPRNENPPARRPPSDRAF